MGNNPPKKNRYRHKSRKRSYGFSDLAKGLGTFSAWVLFIGVMSGLFVFGHDFLTQCNYFEAKSIDISGNLNITTAEIRDILEIKKGDNILSVNLPVCRKRLLASPWIRDAKISREIPSRIIIQVREHTPLAVVNLGRQFLISTEGHIFKKAEPADNSRYPLVSGLEITDFRESQKSASTAFSAVLEVLHLGEAPDSILPNRLIREIRVDREIGVTVNTLGPGRIIHLGYKDYALKYKHLAHVLDYIATRPELTGIDSFDLKNANSVVVNPSDPEPSATDQKEV